ncbi:hypothetical protein SPHINGOT1_110160 [Sphingomonas sp. T1]|nr:hypothetical protein SPHINGOT1_110160 [Sphingomonas sp. T1]
MDASENNFYLLFMNIPNGYSSARFGMYPFVNGRAPKTVLHEPSGVRPTRTDFATD